MNIQLKEHLAIALKGAGMGAANVIPGVSGGTIALITGIFERIIDAIKSFDTKAISLLFHFKFKELFKHTDFFFLIALGSGMIFSIISLARVFKFLFLNYPVYIWAFFFGLIIASIFFVGKTISKWTLSVILSFIVGASIAVIVSFMNPATPNDSFFYLIICGVAAVCSMILPGLSGSFVLILMGNYELVMIDAVNEGNIKVLFPVILGGIVGIMALSHLLSWIFKRFKNQTIAILTGFILGSLGILWPWKHELYRLDTFGNEILKNGAKIVQGYELYVPNKFTAEVGLALLFMLIGFACIVIIEKMAYQKDKVVK
jgi:putative membrane protein